MERVRKKKEVNKQAQKRRKRDEDQASAQLLGSVKVDSRPFFLDQRTSEGAPEEENDFQERKKDSSSFLSRLPRRQILLLCFYSIYRRHYTKSRIYLNLSRDAARETRDRRRERKVLVERNRERGELVKTAKSIDKC